MSFLCTVHRNLCIVNRFLCTLHRKFWPIFCKTLNLYLEPRTKIPTHFKSSDSEIAFLEFHFLLELIIHNFCIIMSRRKLNIKKAISPSEPLKCLRILVLGSKYKFNVLQKIGQNFLCSIHRNLCTMHRFLCTIHRNQICPTVKCILHLL